MSRPVHYHASGVRAMSFECFQKELRAYIEDRKNKPMPKCHTDLTKVTCPNCWRDIYNMAEAQYGRGGQS